MNAHIRDNLNFLYGAPACRVYHNAAQSITTATDTILDFNTERFDNDTMHSTVSVIGRITATTAGRYLVITNAEFAANATGYRSLGITDATGTTYLARETLPIVSAAATTVMNVATIYTAAAADIFHTNVYQNSGGNLNINATGNYSPEFMAHWMGN